MKTTNVFKKNIKAYNEGYRTIVNKGSSRSSKTWSIIQLLYLIALKSKRQLIISIVSRTFPHLKTGVVRDFIALLKQEGMYSDEMHNKSDHYFKIGNSIIEYFSVDNSVKVRGPARDILFINEPNNDISFDTFNHLSIRTTGVIFVDYNPSGEFWLHSEGILKESDTKLIHSTWRDNIVNLSKAQINVFKKNKAKAAISDYWRYWWDVYGEGIDAVLLEERIMPFLNRIDSVTDDAIEIPAGLDFGWSDPLAFSRHWIRKNESGIHDLFVQEVVYQSKLSINTKSDNTTNFVDILAITGFNKSHLIVAESSDPGALYELRNAGFNMYGVHKISVEVSLRLFHDYNIYIVGNSENVFREFNNYKYDRNKEGVILNIPKKGQEDHAIDGTRYVLLTRSQWEGSI